MNEYLLKELTNNFKYVWYSISDEQKKEVADYLMESVDYLIEYNKKILENVDKNLEKIKEICGSEEIYNNVVEHCKGKIEKDEKLNNIKNFYKEEIGRLSNAEYLSITKQVIFKTIVKFLKDDRDLTKYCDLLVNNIGNAKNDTDKKLRILATAEYLLTIDFLDKERLCQSYKEQIKIAFENELAYDGPHYMA